MRPLVVGLWTAATVALGGSAHANPADVFGFGSRAAALGGAATALAVDGSANYYNPAGLARGDALRIDVGYQGGKPWLTLDGNDIGTDATHGLAVAIAAPGTLFGLRVAFGAALFLPDDRVTRSRSLAYAQPRFVHYDNRTQRIYLAANVAVALPGRVYLGGGLAFMARTEGVVSLTGTIALQDTEERSVLASAVGVDLLAVRYPQAGIAWEATRWLTLGASYRGKFLLRIDEGFAIRGDVGNPGVTPVVDDGVLEARTVSADLFQPWQLTAGAWARLTRRLGLGVDLTFARWSEFESPASTVTVHLDLGPRLNPLVPVAPPRVYPAPGFHDILVPRLGAEWRALDGDWVLLDVRGGYSYEPTPAPEQVGESNYADADKHTVSLGAGLTLARLADYLPREVSLDAHLGLTLLPPRAARKSDPADPVGDWVATGRVLHFGLGLRTAF